MKKLDKKWLDSMYNNRALVPDHATHFARWSEASDDVRESHPCQLDMAYGTAALERLDVFTPAPFAARQAPATGAPVVVFIHGGYWRSLDKREHAFIAPAFTNHGACVVVPNYTLCPDVTIPEIVMQMVKALAWTYRNIAKHGGDPTRITVIGHSAGGHLAAMLLACLWPAYAKDLPADLVKNAMSISGLFDLEPLRYTPFLQDSLRLTEHQVLQASPAYMPAPAHGQLHCLVGGDESAEFLRQNTLLSTAWGKPRVPVAEAVPGCNHFSVLEELTAPWTRTHALALALCLA